MPATPPRCRPHCLTHPKRVEWLALSRLRYLTNLTNSRVRSTHPFHTKSPFSRFGGGRRQKSENIIVSARGRRRPQAPTLRTSGCANARKYDYKSNSLYAQSNGVGGFVFDSSSFTTNSSSSSPISRDHRGSVRFVLVVCILTFLRRVAGLWLCPAPSMM